MAKNSIIEYTGDGSTIQYTINFTGGYTLESHVFCRVNDEADGSGDPVYRSLTFISEGLVEIGGTVPANGESIVFQRITPVDTPVVDFEDGVTFTEEDIDAGFEQVLFGIQEAQDNLADAEDTEAAKIAAEAAQAAAELAKASAEAAVLDAESAVTDAELAETNSLVAQAAAEVSAAAAASSVSSIASNTVSVEGSIDINLSSHGYNLFVFHTSDGTANLGTASALGDAFTCFIKADDIAVTINPDGSELINGTASLVLAAGQSAKLYCNGSAWNAVLIGAGSGSGGITYEEKTSAYTAEAGDGIGANTTGGAFTVTLPASPSVGDVVIVTDTHGQWATNNLTIDRNGENIQRVSENLICDISNIQIELVYFSNGWIAYPSGNVVGTVPLYASNNLHDLDSSTASRGNLNTWVDKTAAYTLVVGDWVYADTSGGAFTLTLPASPSEGEEVKVADPNTAWAVNSVTIARNGNTIAGNSDDMECSTGGVSHTLTYNSSSGNWRVRTEAVAGGDFGKGMVKIETIVADGDASMDFTTGFDGSKYIAYKLVISGFIPATDGSDLTALLSSDGGSTWLTTATDYQLLNGYSSTAQASSDTNNFIRLTGSLGNVEAQEIGAFGDVDFYGFDDTEYTMIKGNIASRSSSNVSSLFITSNIHKTATVMNGIQIVADSGNIQSCTATLYGMLK